MPARLFVHAVNVNSGAALLLGFVALAASCTPAVPEYVWVPGADFQVKVEVSYAAGAGPETTGGQWITLHADRESGPWIEVAARGLEPGTQWLRRPPPAREENVESNVRWHVEPAGAAEFNLPTAQDVFSRRVRFAEPGVYSVWATSHDWRGGRVSSNRLTVTVNP